MLWLNDLWTFVLIGMGFQGFNLVVHWFINQRLTLKGHPTIKRRLFFFGGEHPATIGNKINWAAIYIFCYLFALVQSWHLGVGPARLYIEIALSVPQAVFMTIGLFVIDRIEFAIHFLFDKIEENPKSEIRVNQPILNQPPATTETSVQPVTPSTQKKSPLGWFLKRKQNELNELPELISSKVRETVEHQRQASAMRRQNKEAARESETESRIKKFHDLTEGH